MEARCDVPHVCDLEPSNDRMNEMVSEAMKGICDFFHSLPKAKTDGNPSFAYVEGFALARSFESKSAPESPLSLSSCLEILFGPGVDCSLNTTSPGFLGYIPGGGLFLSAVADLISNSINRYTGVALAAPVLVQLESNVIRWFCAMLGYPISTSGGLLLSGGSMATWTAVVAARCSRLGDDFSNGVLYVSDQVHHSATKAAFMAGFRASSVRVVPHESMTFRIDIGALDNLIRDDSARGLRPFLIIGSAGTTNTGSVDDLCALATIAEKRNMWLHVDAAYGGFFCLTDRGKKVLSGIERADSVTLDPHKGLFLPYGTGSLLVKNEHSLRVAFSGSTASYMPILDDRQVDFCSLGPELTRDYRGLRVWLPVCVHGLVAFRRALDEKLELAQWAAIELERINGIELVVQPVLSLFAFRWVPEGTKNAEDLNILNRKFMELINRKNNVLLTGTELEGVFALRVCVLCVRTHADRMSQLLVDCKEALAALQGEKA